ncbi:MAG: hypothetical protein EBU84_07525 [Actinobacteria bacterium]|nr:hypothetical protein [Actinomycetota bacterium]
MYHSFIKEDKLRNLQAAISTLRSIYEREINTVANQRNYKILESEKPDATWQERDEIQRIKRETFVASEQKLKDLHTMSDLIATFETLVAASTGYYNDSDACPLCKKVKVEAES